VRYGGSLIAYPNLKRYADSQGQILFNLVPEDDSDNSVKFNYVVVLYDSDGNKIYNHEIRMPNQDAMLFDLVEPVVDLDLIDTPPPITVENEGLG